MLGKQQEAASGFGRLVTLKCLNLNNPFQLFSTHPSTVFTSKPHMEIIKPTPTLAKNSFKIFCLKFSQ